MTKPKYTIEEINQVLDYISSNWTSRLDKKIQTDTRVKKIAEANLGKKRSLEFIELMRQKSKSYVQTEEGSLHMKKMHKIARDKARTPEANAKRSRSLVSFYQTPEGQTAKANTSNRTKGNKLNSKGATFTGKKHTEESKAKMSAARKGRSLTAEHRAKIGKAGLGKKRSEETKAKIRAARSNPVIVDGIIYNSPVEVAQKFNVSIMTVHRRLKNPNFPTWNFTQLEKKEK